MAYTYNLISSVTLSSAQANITFGSIPATYTDLSLSISARSASSSSSYDDIRLEFNGSGGTAYSTRMLYGNGSNADAAASSGNPTISWSFISSNGAVANAFGTAQIYIPNYTNANYKTISSDSAGETNVPLTIMAITAGLWANTSPITSLKLTTSGGHDFMQHSTAYLYGVSNA